MPLRDTADRTCSLKNAQDRPLTEAAKKRNEEIRAELLNLRSEQFQLSHTVENLKSERQQIMEQAVSPYRHIPWTSSLPIRYQWIDRDNHWR